MNIWAIEEGEYSDYHIVGVFSTRENAERVVNATGVGEIVEWSLDPAIDELNQGLHQFHVMMHKDGSVEKCERLQEVLYYCLNGEHRVLERAYKGRPDMLDSTVWAKDSEHAIKIVNEVRVQWIAEGKF